MRAEGRAARLGRAFRARPVRVEAAGIYAADGTALEDLLAGRRAAPSPLPFASGWLPRAEAFAAAEPDLRSSVYDRKALRTMDKQARLALAAAITCGAGLEPFADPARVGLFMGMPTVEEPVPSWEALAELGPDPADRAAMLQTFLTSTPPMTGLILLNSTACSHVASQFGVTGPTGVFSPWADAGLQALVEAAWSIVEGDNNRALVGGAAPTLNPFLYLHYEAQGLLGQGEALPPPGEGAAFVALRGGEPEAGAAVLSGYARLFEPDPAQAAAARARCIEAALESAAVTAAEVGWVLFDPHCGRAGVAAELSALQAVFGGLPPLGAWHEAVGHLGPAQPVLNVAAAAEALGGAGRVVCDGAGRCLGRETAPLRHVLINASGFEGQFACLVMSRYEHA